MKLSRVLLFLVPAAAFAVIAAAFVIDSEMFAPEGSPQRRQAAEDAMREMVSGEFSLVDHTGRPITDESFRGEWLLMFFGYTHCPDICPTTLGTVALVLDALGEEGARVQPVFVSVDPERDTPEILAEYVAAFHPRIIGATGTNDQVAAAAKSHGVYYAKAPLEEGGEIGEDYAMIHSAHLFLMDPDGVFAGRFSPADPVEELAAGIAGAMRARN